MAYLVDPDDADWIERATRVGNFHVDTLFHVSTRLQFCDPVTGRIIPGEAVLLPTPDLPLITPDWHAATVLSGREQELACHYQRIVDAFSSHGRLGQLQPRSSEFWLRPAIIANGALLTRCSWYDTIPEAEALLQALIDGANTLGGEVWDDLDQGWQIRVVKSGGTICIAEWDWESHETPPSGYAFDAADMAHHAGLALAYLRALHQRLVATLGRDWWS